MGIARWRSRHVRLISGQRGPAAAVGSAHTKEVANPSALGIAALRSEDHGLMVTQELAGR